MIKLYEKRTFSATIIFKSDSYFLLVSKIPFFFMNVREQKTDHSKIESGATCSQIHLTVETVVCFSSYLRAKCWSVVGNETSVIHNLEPD